MFDEKSVFGSLLGLAAEQAEALYEEFRNEESDEAGATELGRGLFHSLTAQGEAFSSLGDAALITAGYHMVLGRTAEDIDPEGWSYWFDRLSDGSIAREDFLANLARGAFSDGFTGTRADLNQQDKEFLTERGDLDAIVEGQSADDVRTALASEGLSSVTEDSVDTAVPLHVDISGITAGALHNDVVVDATVIHAGDAGSVTFELAQGTTDWVETADLGDEARAEHVSVEFDFLDSRGFGPGQMEITVTSEEDGVNEAVSQEFGMYDPEFDVQDIWEWVDTSKQPFDMIGHLVQEDDEGGLLTGTGFMISPQHVMTNAHVVAGDGQSERTADFSNLDNIEFYLGREGVNLREEQDGNLYDVIEANVMQEDWSGDWPDTDMAVLRLDDPVSSLDGQEHFDWFWNGVGAGDDRDLVGEDVFWAGYPSDFLDQGDDGTQVGNPIYFQWMTDGQIDGYLEGADDYGGESGGLDLSWDLLGTGGASGSPVIRENDEGEFEFVGAYVGSVSGSDPRAATLDEAAHDWALTLVQEDGELMDMDFIDAAWDDADLGPSWTSGTSQSATATFVDSTELDVQGLPETEDSDALLIA